MVSLLEAPRLALDLGTGRTRLASLDVPVLAEFSSTLERDDGGGTSRRSARHPLEHGVVVDVEATARLLRAPLRAARGKCPLRPHVLVCHPSDATPEELERLETAILLAGAAAVQLAPEPVAAALGSRGGEDAIRPRLIVDLGEGVTDIAVVLGGRLLASAAVRLGLGEIRDDVGRAIEEEHGARLLPAEISSLLESAEDLGGWLGVTRQARRHAHPRADGRREVSHQVFVKDAVVAAALDGALDTIGRSATGLLQALGGHQARILASDGALLTGGGARFPHLCRGLGQRLGLRVLVAPDPLHAVITGARLLLNHR
jgi:rod shape-determining protein MreB